MRTPSQAAVERIREVRKRHGWTQQELADRLNEVGAHIDRGAVAKVELGTRGLSLDEAFWFALALGLQPVHLFVPVHGDEPLAVAPQVELSPDIARHWIRGGHPVQDPRTYYTEVPDDEWMVRQDTSLRIVLDRVQELVDAVGADNREAVLELINDLNAELETFRRARERRDRRESEDKS